MPAHECTYVICLDLQDSWIELYRLSLTMGFSPSLQPLRDPKIQFLRACSHLDAAEINRPAAQFNITRKKASGWNFFLGLKCPVILLAKTVTPALLA